MARMTKEPSLQQTVGWLFFVLCLKVPTYECIPIFLSGLSHARWCSLVPSICLQILRYHEFLIFFLLNSTTLCKCTTFSLPILWFEGHLGCFQVLAIMNNTATNVVEQIFLMVWLN